MARVSSQKGGPSHLQSRVAYLHKAASYFAGLTSASPSYEQKLTPRAAVNMTEGQESQQQLRCAPRHDMAEMMGITNELAKLAQSPADTSSTFKDEASMRLMLSHIRGIAKKGQVRVSPSIKHSICKRCDALLLHQPNSNCRIDNQSREGRKAWADVLVVTCHSCGTAKRFPIGATRQPRRKDRLNDKHGKQSHSDTAKSSTLGSERVPNTLANATRL